MLKRPAQAGRFLFETGFGLLGLRRPIYRTDGSQEVSMERFFSRKHRRYLQILADPRDEAQRRIILKLLAAEEAALREDALNKKEPP